MRFHVLSLPHTQTTAAFTACAYTEKVRKFCAMMLARGHDVFLYAGEQNEAPCTELITCVSEDERKAAVGNRHYTDASFDTNAPHWRTFIANAIAGVQQRVVPRDFLCPIAGIAHKPVADYFPQLMCVEFGIGYGGTFAKYRVFESYAWMHTVYGAQSGGNAHTIDGRAFDAVIPNYFDVRDFPVCETQDDYFLYVGRLIDRKGYRVAADVCQHIAAPLVIAGPGTYRGYGAYVGVIGPEERGRRMARARALFVPTQYIEPFGGVAIEAMLCGTPVIATDWGAFTETITHGFNGFRCRTFKDFIDATKHADKLDRPAIRAHARAHYSLEAIGERYEDYFTRLLTLYDKGWYQL